MAVVKEYMCMVHGAFENSKSKPLCPHGCDTVERVFLTPPAFRSERTAAIDKTVRDMAVRHGMTNISNSGGEAAKRMGGAQQSREAEFREFVRGRYGDGWGTVPAGGTMNVKTGEVSGSGSGVSGALANYHGQPGNALAEAAPIIKAMGPKPVIVKRDHENLSVANAKLPT